MFTARQLKMRLSGIGASETPAVLGESPFENDTAFSVWKRKCMPSLEPDEPTPAMKFGSCVESGIAEYYAAETGARLIRSSTRRHPKHRFLLCTPDRLWVREGAQAVNVQCKSIGRTMHHWDMASSDGVPPYVNLQVQQEMEVLGLEETHVAALFLLSKDFKIFTVKRDERLAELITEICGEFWHRYCATGQAPLIDISEAASKYLRERYPLPKRAELMPMTPEIGAMAREYAAAAAAVKAAEAVKDLARNRLCDLIGDETGFEGDGVKVTWKPDTRGKTAWKDVAAELGATDEIAEKHRSKPERKIYCHVKDLASLAE